MTDERWLDDVVRRARAVPDLNPAAIEKLEQRLRTVKPRAHAPRLSLVVVAVLAFAAGALTVQLGSRKNTALPAPDALPVTFVLVSQEARNVTLAGDFNDWSQESTPMVQRTDGVWEVVLQLQPGRYNYAFVVNGEQWLADPQAPRSADEDFGTPNSVLVVEHRRSL